ncbi:uncharacterized protein LOC120330010 [Styela clava]
MVSNDNSRNSESEDDFLVTSLNDDVIIRRNSSGSNIQCLHCAFRCTSPSDMTQHSWEIHPLLMRRKKHLFTSSVSSSKSDVMQQFPNGDMNTVPTYQQPIHETALEMRNCSLSSTESSSHPEKITETANQFENHNGYKTNNNAARSLSLLSDAAAILDAVPQTFENVPQRHVAVVKPVPIEAQRLDRPVVAIPPQMVPQYMNKDQFVYAPMYNAYIPSLNQYISIPIPVATGLYQPTIQAPNMINTSIENAMKNYLSTQQTQNTHVLQNSTTQNHVFQAPQTSSQTPTAPQFQPSPQQKHAQTITMPRTNAAFRNGATDQPPTGSNEIRTLLQTGPVVRNMENTIQPKCPTIKPEPLNGHVPLPPSVLKSSSLGKERQKELEKALLSTDCCDIDDSSTTMPFKCPDGVWRMVKFKCIRGLWLVQIPGSPTPTVYVPCDNGKVLKQATIESSPKPPAIGHKRKLSDPTGIGNGLTVKRLCASAPIPGGKPQICAPYCPPMLRTRSNPCLPEPDQQFTNNEGKRVNISVIKRDPVPSTSGSLIRNLLLRKPASGLTSSSVPMTSPLKNPMTSHHGRMLCTSSSSHKIQTNFTHPSTLSTNAMVY